MNWQPATSADWHQLSGCGRYSVCRIRGKSSESFEAWRTRRHSLGAGVIEITQPGDPRRRFAVGLESSARARAICEEDDRGTA